jgi:hypothetical protein
MRIWAIGFMGLCIAGCQIDVLEDDWGPDGDGECAPASCGSDHARLSVAVPMAEGQSQQTDLWLNVCHGGRCADDVHLEWRCPSQAQPGALECTAGADVLDGRALARRGGSCGAAETDLCLELDLPTDGLAAGNTPIAVRLDDAVSGRRVVDDTFEVELSERVVEACGQATTCLNGERRERAPAFDPATASPGAH